MRWYEKKKPHSCHTETKLMNSYILHTRFAYTIFNCIQTIFFLSFSFIMDSNHRHHFYVFFFCKLSSCWSIWLIFFLVNNLFLPFCFCFASKMIANRVAFRFATHSLHGWCLWFELNYCHSFFNSVELHCKKHFFFICGV